VTAVVAMSQFSPDNYLLLASAMGEVKKTNVDSFCQVRSSGLIAMDLVPGDSLVAADQTKDGNDIILVTRKGQSVRFPVAELRTSLRASGGVRGIELSEGDQVVSMDIVHPDTFVLVVSSGGFGKITPINEYPVQQRAGSGVRTFRPTDKTGLVAAAKVVTKTQQIMIISANGIITCTPVTEEDPRLGITIQGRSTQGVRLMKLEEGDQVVAIAAYECEEEI